MVEPKTFEQYWRERSQPDPDDSAQHPWCIMLERVDPSRYAELDAAHTAHAFTEASKPPPPPTQPHAICDTNPCCECSMTGVMHCDCIWGVDGHCKTCGAKQLA